MAGNNRPKIVRGRAIKSDASVMRAASVLDGEISNLNPET